MEANSIVDISGCRKRLDVLPLLKGKKKAKKKALARIPKKDVFTHFHSGNT